MKILHTADWHLCDRLGKINRTAALRERVERVAEYCGVHHVELMLLAGDLFYEKATEEEIAESLSHISQTFQPFFKRGGTIVAITGNHDPDNKIQLVRSGAFIAAPISTGEFQPGRFYLQNGLSFGKFTSPAGEQIQLVLVPYPHSARYGLPDTYRTREEEYRLLQERLGMWLKYEVRASAAFDQTLPTVLMAHLHIRGANVNRSLFRFSNPTDVQMEAADLMAGWAYVALGHIHLPQSIGGVESVRYPGPLDRLDFGELDDERGVILVDLSRDATRTTWLPLEPTKMYQFTITDPDEELTGLAEKYPDHQQAIAKIVVNQTATPKLSRDEIARRIRAIFPQLYSLTFEGDEPQTPGEQTSLTTNRTDKSFAQIVRDYVSEQLGADSESVEVLALCEEFLAKESEGVAS